jgi:signal transduction histidine kinase
MTSFKVLVVDDEAGIRSGTRRILQNHSVDFPFMDEAVHFEVLEAGSGEEAIPIIDEARPEIVLLDNKLPGMEGIEVLEYIRNKQYDILVIMITSYASLELAVKATRDGAYDFIPKPFTPQELRSSLENVTKKIFLKRMTQKLNQDARQIRFQFLSVLSHELKAPLHAIEGYVKMIQQRELGNELKDYNEIVERTLQRVQGMRNLILDLLDFTKIESGKPTQHISKVDLREIARTAMDTIQPYAIQKDVSVTLDAPDEISLMADPEEMEIILNNLLSNAVKYNKPQGSVRCMLRREEGAIRLEVSDTGIGMAKEDIDKLFRDFVRIRNPKTRNISGSGLGLSIVKKILQLYEADISVRSEPDAGSTFIILFKNPNLSPKQ